MSEKLCCFCENIQTSYEGCESGGYYDVMYCSKGHFNGPMLQLPLDRKFMQQAETCPDYEQVKA